MKDEVVDAIQAHGGSVEGTMDALRQDFRFGGSNSQLRVTLDVLVRENTIKPVENRAGNAKGPMRTFAYQMVAGDALPRFVR